jgi:hypothetical protein
MFHFLKGKSIWSIGVPADSSWNWIRILKTRPVVWNHSGHVIGNGEGAFLWWLKNHL